MKNLTSRTIVLTLKACERIPRQPRACRTRRGKARRRRVLAEEYSEAPQRRHGASCRARRRRGILSQALIVSGILLAACASQPPRGTATNTYEGDQAGKRDEFIGDRDLAAKFVLVGIKTEPRDGRLRVQFDLKNTTPADLAVEWAIEWKDRSGFRVATNPHWQPAMVSGQGFQTIQAVAPTSDAAVFQLCLRKPTTVR